MVAQINFIYITNFLVFKLKIVMQTNLDKTPNFANFPIFFWTKNYELALFQYLILIILDVQCAGDSKSEPRGTVPTGILLSKEPLHRT